MAKIIRNVKVDWTWSGDNYAILGFNVAITPINGNPNTGAVQVANITDGTLRTYTFNNITLDNTTTYAIWVQAIYDGGDSSWVSATTLDDSGNTITKPFVVSDDGTATVETQASNIANQWKHDSDPNKINGADIYTGSITADKINLYGYLNVISPKGSSFSVDNSGNVKLSGDLTSFNYSTIDNKGWSITADGKAVLNDAIVRGSVILPNSGVTNFGNVGNKNLVQNTRFDTLGTNFFGNGSYTLSIDNTNQYENYNSLKIVGTTVGDTVTNRFYFNINESTQKVGDKYTISFYAKSLSGTNAIYVRGGGSSTSNPVTTSNVYTGWTKYICTITITSTPTGQSSIVMWATNADTFWISELKVEKGDIATDWSPAPEDGVNYTRIWAGSDYINRDTAPFRVLQDGTMYATKGYFNGTFTGVLNVGNIHITDTDPNTNGNQATIMLNTDNDTRQIISMNENRTFHDQNFIIGNDNYQYFVSDNDNASTSINNNSFSIKQFNKNILLDSTFISNLFWWGFGTNVIKDTSLLFNGYTTIKDIQSGLANDSWRGIFQNVACNVGDVFTGSVYTYSDDISKFDSSGVKLCINFLDGTYSQLDGTSITITPTKNNTWERHSMTSIVAPAYTEYVQFQAYVMRNGRVWFACPQIERGNNLSPWGINLYEQKNVVFPNRVDEKLVNFQNGYFGNYSFDIKSDYIFYFESSSNQSNDFVFVNNNASNSVNVLIDGSIQINDSIKINSKLTIQRKTDSGNQGIDFIFN